MIFLIMNVDKIEDDIKIFVIGLMDYFAKTV